ncbi:Hypothetical protein NTJ_12121 [Nesidiocoris tenuis]|uniref:PHD-type domain-containing protein n=1 Tax=Nesidiocoris tenuis TaxID=355587 RepID=A0ABN7B617_9HEMI|nr:Hypothetical protein NTJ_12121 [Nesidiocoris tenuis]
MECAKCDSANPPADPVKCATCAQRFHASCTRLESLDKWTRMSYEKREAWRCDLCRHSDESPKPPTEPPVWYTSLLSDLHAIKNDLQSVRSENDLLKSQLAKTKKSSCVGGLSGAYCYLEFGQLLSNPQDAIAALDENVKQHALDTIKTLTADEWERVRRLYGMLKRAGKVDQLLVYEFARDIVKSCKGEENMEKFLSEFDADQSEAAFKFGLTLLTIFHASFVLAGSNDEVLTFSNSKTDQRAFPELAHSARISRSKNPEEIFQRMPVQRRNFFSGHNRRCDVLRNSMAKIAPRKYVNPAYAHVKSRYMDALKPKPRMGSARTKGYYRSPGSQNSRDQNQAKSRTAPCTNERQRLSMLYDQDDRPTTESTFASTTEIESATAESEKASELLGDSYKTASSRRNKILNVPSNSMISLVKPRKLCNSLASDSETEPDTGKCKKLSMKTGHYQGMGDCSKPQRTNQSKIDNDRTDKSVSTEMETASKPSWKLLKIPPDDDSDATASSCEEKVWKSSNSTMDSSKIELARSK